jgi:alkylation response protein AidB-like acyl-CoA dehydrogenase
MSCKLFLQTTLEVKLMYQGGNGYINGQLTVPRSRIKADRPDYPAGRLLRDSRLYTVGAGTQEIRRMLIGRGFNEQFAAVDGRAIAQ